ncbi:MAG: primosomal protein N' [Bacillota bacterium]
MYAEVVVDIPSESTKGIFHYSVPCELEDQIKVGSAVLVPFGARKITGYVVGFTDTPDVACVKDIHGIRGDSGLGDELTVLARWMNRYYTCSLGEAIAQMFPSSVRRGRTRPKFESVVNLAISADEAETLITEMECKAPRQAEALRIVLQKGPILSKRLLTNSYGATAGAVRALIAKGILSETEREVLRNPIKKPRGAEKPPPVLTPEQDKAVQTIIKNFDEERKKPFLLHGVTASGKTEVYMRVIEAVLERGKSAIVLVPEIALTPQMTRDFSERFKEKVAVLHSRLSQGERYDEWRRAGRGDARIVVGARSAVFAPVRNLGAIIVDEEHETSYKQEESPKYHARDVACERARISKAVCILGSATPSVESYYKALNGDYTLLELPYRVENKELPTVEVVDMREELAAGNRSIFSRPLFEAISDRLEKKEQVILFLNRRGYSTFVLCRECGYSMRCPNCDVALTYHAAGNRIRCHYCDFEQPVPSICPNCGGRYIRYFGAGTQKIEGEVKRVFPHARTIRMDTDTTRRKGAHETIVTTFQKGEYDILIGTQMVAKGLDFPNVTLVGVISADTCLNLPDYKAGERTFQLLTQVAGRAGRGEKRGHVVVQTYSPGHYAIEQGTAQDYRGFYDEEIACRSEGGYPPFSRLILVVVSGKNLSEVERHSVSLAKALQTRTRSAKQWKNTKILGPSPCAMSKVKGMHRWQILLKVDPIAGPDDHSNLINDVLKACPVPSYGIMIQVDVDPENIM